MLILTHFGVDTGYYHTSMTKGVGMGRGNLESCKNDFAFENDIVLTLKYILC